MTEPAMIPPTPGAAPQAGAAAHGTPPSVPAQPRKLDLSRIAPPQNLESIRIEELSIDGICGVY